MKKYLFKLACSSSMRGESISCVIHFQSFDLLRAQLISICKALTVSLGSVNSELTFVTSLMDLTQKCFNVKSENKAKYAKIGKFESITIFLCHF